MRSIGVQWKKGVIQMATKHRTREKTVCFRVTMEEYHRLVERIRITGLPKNQYMIRSMLEQRLELRAGKFESDRLAVELKRLRIALQQVQCPEDWEEVLLQCQALLEQVIQITNCRIGDGEYAE